METRNWSQKEEGLFFISNASSTLSFLPLYTSYLYTYFNSKTQELPGADCLSLFIHQSLVTRNS